MLLLKDSNPAVIAQQQLESFRLDRRFFHDYVPPDQAILDPAVNIENLAVFQDDGVLDLAIGNGAVVVDRGKGADVAVDDPAMLPDDGRAAYHAIDDLGG